MDVGQSYDSPPNRFIIVAPLDWPDQMAAFCALVRHEQERVELKNVVVNPANQGQRLGTMLMDATPGRTATKLKPR